MPASEVTATSPALTVVLSTLGNYPVLRRVLDGYERQDVAPGTFEVIVVADRAEPDLDAVDEAVGSRPYPVRRLTGRVQGLSANRNVGWQAARSALVLFTDNDTIPVPTLVSEHLGWHLRNPAEEVAVVGHIRWAEGLRVTPFMRWLDRGVQFDFHAIRGEEASWAHLYGANSSIKRRFVERVGGFDEVRLPYLYEDLDWGYRASRLGLRVLYNRRAIVDHWRPMTLDVWRTRARQLAVTEYQFTQIHPEIPPHFHRMFSAAARAPVARGHGERLARFVPRGVPWLGPRVWRSADLVYKQAIAPHFLAGWEEAERDGGASVAPDVDALLAERSAG